MSNQQINGYDSDRLSQDSQYEGAARGSDEPDIFHDDDIVEIYLRLKSESEGDFSDFTDEEEEKKQEADRQENQEEPEIKEDGEDEWITAGQDENDTNNGVQEESEHEPPNEA